METRAAHTRKKPAQIIAAAVAWAGLRRPPKKLR